MRKVVMVGDARPGSGPYTRQKNLLDGFQQERQTATTTIVRKKLRDLFRIDVWWGKEPTTIITYTHDLVTLVVVGVNIFFRLPHIHVVLGDFYTEKNSKKGLKKLFWVPINLFFCRRSDLMVVISSRLQQRITKQGTISAEEIVIIPPAYDFSVTPEQEIYTQKKNEILQCITVTSFTHFDKGRGVIDLVHALQKQAKNMPIQLTIIGGGKRLTDIQEQIGIVDPLLGVVFAGACSPEKVVARLHTSDLFLYCSYLDSGPQVLLEAIDAGIPVLSNDIGYVAHLLHADEEQWSGRYTDRVSFHEKFSLLAGDSHRRDLFAQKQKQHAVQHYGFGPVQNAWQVLLDRLEKGRKNDSREG